MLRLAMARAKKGTRQADGDHPVKRKGEIERTGIDALDYSRGCYQLRITKSDLPSKAEFLENLMKRAHANRTTM